MNDPRQATLSLTHTIAPQIADDFESQRLKRIFDRAVFVFSSRDVPAWETLMAIQAVSAYGAIVLEPVRTIPDLALARNIGLTQAYDICASDLTGQRQVVVTFDDDNGWTPQGAALLIEAAILDGQAHMGCYVNVSGVLMGAPIRRLSPQGRVMWMGGLGICAIPLKKLQELAKETPERVLYKEDRPPVIEFCNCAARWTYTEEGPKRMWCMDDRWLLTRLGGAIIEPEVIASHKKGIALQPTVQQVTPLIEQANKKMLDILSTPPVVPNMPAP